MRRFSTTIAFLLTILFSCKKDTEERCAFTPDTKGIALDIKIKALQDSVAALDSPAQAFQFFTRHPELRDLFFHRGGYENDSIFYNKLFIRFTDLHFDTLLTDVHRVYGDSTFLKKEFGQAFTNLRYYYPKFHPPAIETVQSGLETDLVVTDSLVIVGLDYYLGPGAVYRPNAYEYILRRYKKEFIVPSVLLLYGISPFYNKTGLTDQTVLTDMIAFGKAYYFAKRMLPCLPDSVFIGYTPDEIAGARQNESQIYSRFIDDEVLYSTSHQVKQHYLDERPKTLEIGEQCPGRIAQWIGWQIVNAYAENHPNLSLKQIMEVTDANAFFKDSKYRPAKK